MINKYYNNHRTLCLLMIMSITTSIFLHVFFIIFLIDTTFFYVKIDCSNIKQSHNIIKLLPMNYANTESVLQKECLSTILEIATHGKILQSDTHKAHKIVENFGNISDSVGDCVDIIDKHRSSSNVDNREFYRTNSTEYGANHGKSIITPNIIKYFHPKYPDSAKLLGIEGELKVMYNVNVMGRIEKIRILSSMPSGVFENNVKLAMRRWIYAKNKPIENLTVVFRFSLNKIQSSVN